MKYTISLFTKTIGILTLLLVTIGVQAQGMDFFRGTWADAKEKAKKENKHLVVDAYASWCGPCKKMSQTTFKNKEVGDFYNEQYINFKIDMEKGEGPELNEIFRVTAFPTIIYFDPMGKEVRRFKGFRPAGDFLLEGKKALVSLEKLAEMEKAYKTGKQSPAFVREYIEFLEYAEQPNDAIIQAYLETQSKKDLKSDANKQLFYNLVGGIEDPFFNIIMEDKPLYDATYGKEAVTQKLRNTGIKSFQKALEQKDEKLFKKVIDSMEGMDFERKDLLVIQMKLEYFKKIKDWEKYAEIAQALNDVNINNAGFLNDVAWHFYLHIEDKEALENAEKWVKRSISLKSEYHNNDTFAAILFKQGKIKAGKAAAKRAIEIAKKTRKNYKSTQALIDKYTKE